MGKTQKTKPDAISGLALSNPNGLELNFETGILEIPLNWWELYENIY